MPRRAEAGRRLAVAFGLGLSALLLPGAGRADTVACHLTYGGETRVVEAAPVASPYTVAPQAIGSYLLFRIVFRQAPADLAGIKLYTYAALDDGPALLHQASYPYPAPAAGRDGFSGRHYVYEPRYGAELQYWCELKDGAPR